MKAVRAVQTQARLGELSRSVVALDRCATSNGRPPNYAAMAVVVVFMYGRHDGC